MQPSSHLSRTLDGVDTEVVIQKYADRILVLVSQLGKVGNLIQASIPPTTPLDPPSYTSDDIPLFEPPSSIELIPLLGGAPSQHLAALHPLYASHIATLIWTVSTQAGDGAGRPSVVVGLALKKRPGDDGGNASLSISTQNTFKGIMKMVSDLQNKTVLKSAVTHSPSPLGFGFGLSTAALPGWQPPAMQPPAFLPSPSHQAFSAQKTAQKRRHDDADDDESMDRSPTPERRPTRRIKQIRQRLPESGSHEGGDHDKPNKENKSPGCDPGDGVDIGMLLASLPPQSLLPILTSLLSENPSLMPTVLSLIPRPTLDTALNAINQAAKKLRDEYPYSVSSPLPLSQQSTTSPFGSGSNVFGTNRSNISTSLTTTSGFGRSSHSPAHNTGMRDSYVLSRLRPLIAEFVSTAFSYMPYFSYRSESSASQPTLPGKEKVYAHPTETFGYLSVLTDHLLCQNSLCQSTLGPLILPRLLQEWMAWVNRVDMVLKQGGIFGSGVAQSWVEALDRYAEAKLQGVNGELGDGLKTDELEQYCLSLVILPHACFNMRFRSIARKHFFIFHTAIRALNKTTSAQASVDRSSADPDVVDAHDIIDTYDNLTASGRPKGGVRNLAISDTAIRVEPEQAGYTASQCMSSLHVTPEGKSPRGISQHTLSSQEYPSAIDGHHPVKFTQNVAPLDVDTLAPHEHSGLSEEHFSEPWIPDTELRGLLKSAVSRPYKWISRPRLFHPVTPEELELRLHQALTRSPLPSLSHLIFYHNAYPLLQSASSYNFLIQLAIRHTTYTVAFRLLKSLQANNIEPNSYTKQLFVRLLVRIGRWDQAWSFVHRELSFGDKQDQLQLLLEMFGRSKPEEFHGKPPSTEYTLPGVALGQPDRVPQIHDTRTQCTIPQDVQSLILPSLSFFLPASGLPPDRFVLVVVRYLLQKSHVEVARAVTLEWISRIPKRLSLHRKSRCLYILHLHLGYSRTGLKAHFANRKFVNTFLEHQPHLRPTSSTLLLLLGSLKQARPKPTYHALQLVYAFRKKWGRAMVDRRVRRRIVTIAEQEGHIKVAKEWLSVENRALVWRKIRALQREVIGDQNSMLPRRIRRIQSRKVLFLALGTVCCGVGPGGSTSMVARVSLIDYRGNTILDTYVHPTMPVTDYRTSTTGIEAKHLNSDSAMQFNAVQSLVAEYIKGKILVGHSLWQDLSVLGIPHPAVATRDVALYMPFRNALQSPNQAVGLQTLVWHLMRRRIQYGKLDSVENARAALDLYRSDATSWESSVSSAKWAVHPPTFLVQQAMASLSFTTL
ncbi:hypothetical protein EW145_g1982 [Phellinidium pouzarii]|uniref:Tethering factor for nuclear proteasome STS1 n=1 Tax=Phellinidium pouzarii TaxID=167371 RepID=A0A4S4LCH2_9AGAM|nr:hypothetical protein EW145_g1982 [Phellinidium pouzarii]